MRHFLPWCVLHMPVDVAGLDAGARTVFREACDAAGVPHGASRDEIVACFDAWYAAHPPNPALAAALEEAWRASYAEDAPAQDALARFAGTSSSGVLGGGVRPVGTVPGGPLARLGVMAPKKPSKR